MVIPLVVVNQKHSLVAFNDGEITFKSVNLDEKEGEALGATLKVEGQTLLIVSGDKRVDLTDKGFMYANNSPDKLKAEIKKAIDGLIK